MTKSSAVKNSISVFGQNFRSCILNFQDFKLRRQCPSADRLFDQICTHIYTYRVKKDATVGLRDKRFFKTRIALRATSKEAQYYGYYDSSHLLGKYSELIGAFALVLAQGLVVLSAPLLCTNPVIAAIFISLVFSIYIKYTVDTLSYYNDLPKNIEKCIERKCHMLFGPDFAHSLPYYMET